MDNKTLIKSYQVRGFDSAWSTFARPETAMRQMSHSCTASSENLGGSRATGPAENDNLFGRGIWAEPFQSDTEFPCLPFPRKVVNKPTAMRLPASSSFSTTMSPNFSDFTVVPADRFPKSRTWRPKTRMDGLSSYQLNWFRQNLNQNTRVFPIKLNGVSCKFSLKAIQ